MCCLVRKRDSLPRRVIVGTEEHVCGASCLVPGVHSRSSVEVGTTVLMWSPHAPAVVRPGPPGEAYIVPGPGHMVRDK